MQLTHTFPHPKDMVDPEIEATAVLIGDRLTRQHCKSTHSMDMEDPEIEATAAHASDLLMQLS